MSKVDVKDLMIHVERIVRPVRATEGRKLLMRRELLGHLQAALEEERERGLEDAAAFEGAKRRLGVPEELTRGLQRSVPVVQRTLLVRVPLLGWMNPWEKKMGGQMGMGGMSMAQQGLFTLGAALLAYGTMIVLAMRIVRMYREQMTQALSLQPWQWSAGNVAGGALLLLFMGSCFAVAGDAANRRGARKILRHGAWAALWLLLWQIDIVAMVAGQPLTWQDFAWGVPAVMLLVAGLAGLGRLTLKMGISYREWLTLEIAE